MEDGVQYRGCDNIGERHPAKEVAKALKGKYTSFLGLAIKREIRNNGRGMREGWSLSRCTSSDSDSGDL